MAKLSARGRKELVFRVIVTIPDYDPDDARALDRVDQQYEQFEERLLLTAESNLFPGWRLSRS